MEIIFITALVAQLIIGFVARREETEKGKFLAKSAQFLYRKIFCHALAKSSSQMKVDRYMVNLHPGKNREQITAKYYIEKIRLSYALILLGNFLALVVSLHISQNSRLVEEILVPKESWERGSYTLDLTVAAPDDENSVRDITLVVEPVSLDEDEISKLAENAFIKLRTVILGQNSSLSQIVSPLNLVTGLADYPFTITWESDNHSRIKTNGRIDNHDMLSEDDSSLSGEVIRLTAHLHYRDQWMEYHFSEDLYVYLLPYLVAEDEWMDVITKAIATKQQESAFSESFYLPEEISGIAVNWQEIKTPSGLYLWLMVVVAAVITFIGQDHDLQKKVVLRDRQIDRDYPELVRKLALYLGAGLTLRGAWKRVAWDYHAGKSAGKMKYLYEEMLFSVREVENGVSEREVYEHFGKRVGIAKYRKLAGLLSNHLQKGNKNLLQVLREEMELALEDRKKAARAIGEEMSTKLLLPMMLMLLIVMIIIMVPAFQMY
jgi:hypothetical protein